MTLNEFAMEVLSKPVPFVDKGRDWDGLDCWGLLRLCYKEVYGIELPSYADRYNSTSDFETLCSVVLLERTGQWVEVDEAQAGDGVSLRIAALPIHIGVMLDKTWVLHTEEKTGPMRERVDNLVWDGKVDGYFRYKHTQG